MIQYALKCSNGHAFDSWFQSASAFDSLSKGGHLICPVCGSSEVAKSVMAPRVAAGRQEQASLAAQETAQEKALTELRRQVEENATYVGGKFAQEARAIHQGDSPERAIYGEAKLEEAKALIEEGVPVAPLPFIPKTKAN